jgi:hypothetical protein
MEGPGSDVGKGKLPIVACGHLLVWRLILARESDPGSNDGSSSLIDNCSTDASCQSLIGLLRTSGCFCSRCSNRAAFYYVEDEERRRLGQNRKAAKQDTQAQPK